MTSIVVGHIQRFITSANNTKTILPSLEPLDQTKFYLRPFFFEIKSIFSGNNTKRGQKKITRSLSMGKSCRPSFVSLQETPGLLSTTIWLKLSWTCNISQKKAQIGPHIQNILKMLSNIKRLTLKVRGQERGKSRFKKVIRERILQYFLKKFHVM